MEVIRIVDMLHKEYPITRYISTELTEEDRTTINDLIQQLLIEKTEFSRIALKVDEMLNVMNYETVYPLQITYMV